VPRGDTSVSAYVARRLAWGIAVLVIVSALSFLLTFVAPGDPARAIAGLRASAEDVGRIRVALGLDQPPLDQLVGYFGRVLRGDLGHSFKQNTGVLDLILARLPATVELAVAGLAFALLLGVPLGVAAARRPGGRADRLATVLASIFISIPGFVLGLVMIYAFAFLPSQLWGIRLFTIGTKDFDPLNLHQLLLPALTLGLIAAPFYVRITRTGLLDELHADYIRTARAKGLSERTVVWHHAFRNALVPIVSQAGLDLGFFLGGVIVIEAIFGWPGIGRQAVMAITGEDLPLLMGTVLFATLCIVVANIVVDVGQTWLDPRVQAGQRE
jgi:peptide/nickel transport system permease protein